MWLTLCSLEDDSALTLAMWCERANVEHMVVLAKDLVQMRYEHRVSNDVLSASFTLPNGRRISMSEVSLLNNRLFTIPPSAYGRLDDVDKSYAWSEWAALLASFCACTAGPVLCPPTGDNPGGAALNAVECVHYAARCGLTVSAGLPIDPKSHVSSFLVVGDRVLPEAPASIESAMLELAHVLERNLLQVNFVCDPEAEWIYLGCESTVEFRLAEEGALIDALHALANQNGNRNGIETS